MNDLISRQDAIGEFYKRPNINWTTLDVLAVINDLPSVPERKAGHWVPIDDEPHEDYECDVCGYISEATFGPGGVSENMYNYCPNCGARMEEDDED